MFPDYLKSRKCGVTFQARDGGATSVPAKVMKCVVLAAQCTVGVSSMLEPVTPDTVPVQDLTCDLKGDRYDSFISMRMFCIISAILWITGFMTGVYDISDRPGHCQMWQVNLLPLIQRFVELQHRAFCHYPTYHGVEQLSEKTR